MEQKILPFDLYERMFSAFSGHMVEYKGVVYPTVEHAYHCQRYADPKIVEEIKTARSAKLAWQASQKYKSQQIAGFDEGKVLLMEDICRAKLRQHEDVREVLLWSEGMAIIKTYPDSFWGVGLEGEGRNELGKLWMRLREELKSGTTSA
jgi:ribA/ribD-fused uncharacterized protein